MKLTWRKFTQKLAYFSLLGGLICLGGYSRAVGQAHPEFGPIEIQLKLAHAPRSIKEFTIHKHLPPWTQDKSLICWSFSTHSFIESELFRLYGSSPRLNVEYPLYFNLQEKARYWLQTRGRSRFYQGDLFSGALKVIQSYGTLPAEAYGQKHQVESRLDHHRLSDQLNQLLQKFKHPVKDRDFIFQLKSLIDQELGRPPEEFIWGGRSYTPQSFRDEVVNLPWRDYRVITSLSNKPLGEWVSLDVPDNWRGMKSYFNVSLQHFTQGVKHALHHGFTVAIDADVSEPSIQKTNRYAIHLSEDPVGDEQGYRGHMMASGETTDDHLMHIVGYLTIHGNEWYLVKDSVDSSWRDPDTRGYLFLHESYIKYKVLAYLVHQDGIPQIMSQLRRGHAP